MSEALGPALYGKISVHSFIEGLLPAKHCDRHRLGRGQRLNKQTSLPLRSSHASGERKRCMDCNNIQISGKWSTLGRMKQGRGIQSVGLGRWVD